MKILVIDDELVSRQKMKKIMDCFGLCDAVESGSAAVAAFQKALKESKPFDLLTLDIDMPEMDGTETLFNIREIEDQNKIPKEKQAIIIMVTSHSDKDNIITCIQAGCNDYVVKPFNKEIVREKLDKFLTIPPSPTGTEKNVQQSSAKTIADIVEDAMAGSKSESIKLPSMPQISIKFKELLKERADVKEVADLLQQDMAISAKLISLSNSVMYKGSFENKTMEQAIGRLGLASTKKYVDVISNRGFYDGINEKYTEYVNSLWEHSLSCAYASQILAGFANLEDPEEVFAFGLMHDIGKLMLMLIVSKLEDEGRYGDGIEKEELYKSIDERHVGFGVTILKKWKFSDLHIRIAMYHDHLDKDKNSPVSKELLVVHFANLLVKSLGYCVAQQLEVNLETTDSALKLELDSEKISETKKKVRERMDELSKIIS